MKLLENIFFKRGRDQYKFALLFKSIKLKFTLFIHSLWILKIEYKNNYCMKLYQTIEITDILLLDNIF